MKRCLFVDAKKPPELDFVLPGLLAGTAGMLVGQGAIGKTMLALQIGMAFPLRRPIAEGQPGLAAGELWPAPSGGKVLVVMGEDPPPIIAARQHALIAGMGLPDVELQALDRDLEIVSATDAEDDLRIVQRGQYGNLEQGPFADQLIQLCAGRRLVILDPLALLVAGVEENDNGHMTKFMRVLGGIASSTKAAILVLHHVGKSGNGGGEEWERSRGASGLTTAVRLQINLTPPTKADCDELGIAPDEAAYWVRVAQVKANYSAPRAAAWLHRGKGGILHHYPLQSVAKTQSGKKGGRNGSPF